MKYTSRKHTVVAAACAVLLAFSFSSCKKDDGSVNLKINAVEIGVDSKQKNYIDGDTLILETGDQVNVNGGTHTLYAESSGGTWVNVRQSEEGYALLYPATAGSFSCTNVASGSGSVSIPASQTYTLTNNNKNQKLEMPMVAYVADENQVVKFRNVASVLKVVVRNCKASALNVNSITVSGAGLCGTLPYTYNTGNVTPGVLENAGNTVTLNCSTTVPLGSFKAFHLIVAPFAAQQLSITVNTGANEVESQNVTKSLALGKMGVFDFVYGNDIPACTQALFSVSATQKVTFSPGNLQRKGSTTAWQLRFAPTQWDNGTKVAYKNQEPSDVNAWYGLFSWGTGNQAASYVNVGDNNFVDHGVNPIQLGNTAKTYTENYWRTLTESEWLYVFNNTSRGELRFIDCEVHNQSGMIIFPDQYDTTGITVKGVFNDTYNEQRSSGSNFWKITDNDWAALEKRGCVFLPFVGYYANGSYSNTLKCFLHCNSGTSGRHITNLGSSSVSPVASSLYGATQCTERLVHNAVGF